MANNLTAVWTKILASSYVFHLFSRFIKCDKAVRAVEYVSVILCAQWSMADVITVS